MGHRKTKGSALLRTLCRGAVLVDLELNIGERDWH